MTNDIRGTLVKRILLALLAAAMVAVSGTTAFAHRGHDDGGKAKERVFTLTPDPSSSPEGIDFDKRTRAFYVSITGNGATTGGDIYRGRLGSDKVKPFIPGGAGKNAVGLEVQRGKLYVAGGASGAITVYDLETKQPIATFQTGTGGFLNDLVVTRRGDVYVTDSQRPTLWHVTRDQVKAGSDFIALSPDRRSKLTIGVHDKSPASIWLVKHGLEAQAKPYQMMSPDPDQYPGQLIEKDLAQGKIDVAIVWGPIAGYYAKRVRNVELIVVPLQSEPGVKFDYAIAMGVRYGEREWKETIEKLIVENQPAITGILREYGVPLVNERGEPM